MITSQLRAIAMFNLNRCGPSIYALGVLVSFSGSNVLAESPGLARSSWPRFLNATMDGVAMLSPDAPASIADLDWSESPSMRWSLELGDGYGIGVVSDAHYFHFDAIAGRQRLRKVDVETGREIWSASKPLQYRDLYGYETGPRCCPAISGDRIVTYGVDGELTCRSCIDGTEHWSIDTNATYGVVQNFFGVGSSPLIVDDLVLVMVGGSPIESQSVAPGQINRVAPNGSLMLAFSLDDGSERWRSGDDLASYSSPRTMQVGERTLVVVFARDHLHLMDPADGRILARVYHRAEILESVNAMVPVVVGRQIFISDCYDLGAALFEVTLRDNEADLVPIWRDPPGDRRSQAMRSHLSTPIVVDDALFGCSGRNAPDSDFRCIDFRTGRVRWTALERGRSTATRLGDVLLILKESGMLHVAEASSAAYRELGVWNLRERDGERPGLAFPCWSAPVVVGNQVLIRGDSKLVSLALPGLTQP